MDRMEKGTSELCNIPKSSPTFWVPDYVAGAPQAQKVGELLGRLHNSEVSKELRNALSEAKNQQKSLNSILHFFRSVWPHCQF